MEYNKYVKQAQKNLIDTGYFVGKAGADGKFGKDTLEAVNKVIADAKTQKAKDENKQQYAFNVELEYGEKGEDEKNLQRLLKKWHMEYYLGDAGVDGIFGRGTKQAVIEFQKGVSMKPTGVVHKFI